MFVRRDDFVQLGHSHSLAVDSLPPATQSIITSDPVLKAMVHDHVIRGEDFGAMHDRLVELDKADRVSGKNPFGLSRAEALYRAAGGTTDDARPTDDVVKPTRTRMGIFGDASGKGSASGVGLGAGKGSGVGASNLLGAPLAKTGSTSKALEGRQDLYKGPTADAKDIKTDAKYTITSPKGDVSAKDAKAQVAAGDAALAKADAAKAKGDHAKAAELYQEAAQAYANAGEDGKASEAAVSAGYELRASGNHAGAASMFMSAGRLAERDGNGLRAGNAYLDAGRSLDAAGRIEEGRKAKLVAGDTFLRASDTANTPMIGTGKLYERALARRCLESATSAYLEAGATIQPGKSGHDELRVGGKTVLDLEDADEVVSAGGANDPGNIDKRFNTTLPRPAGDAAAARADYHQMIGDRLFASGDYAGAKKHYERAKTELDEAGRIYGKNMAKETDHIDLKIAACEGGEASLGALEGSSVPHESGAKYGASIQSQTKAKDWKGLEGTLKTLDADLRANPDKFSKEEATKLVDDLDAAAEAAKKDGKWGLLEWIGAILGCLTVILIPLVVYFATRETDQKRVAELAERVKADAAALRPAGTEAKESSKAAMADALRAEQSPLEIPAGLELELSNGEYNLKTATPAMKAVDAYVRAYRADDVDPAMKPKLDARAGEVMKAEMDRVEADPNVSSLQKAVYFETCASMLGGDQQAAAKQKAAKYYAEVAAKAKDPMTAATAADHATRLTRGSVSSDSKAAFEAAAKNLGALAAKSTGEEKAMLLYMQAECYGRAAQATFGEKDVTALNQKAADAAEAAVKAAPLGSHLRADALATQAKYEKELGHDDRAAKLHVEAAEAYETAAKTALASKGKSTASKEGDASEAYGKASEEYLKAGKNEEAKRADAESLAHSTRSTQATITALAPPAVKWDPWKPVTGAEVASFEEKKIALADKSWKVGGPHTKEEYEKGAAHFTKLAKETTDPAAKQFYAAAARRWAAMAEMAAHMPTGSAPLTQPPSEQNLKDYARGTKADFVAAYEKKHGKAPSDAEVAAHVGGKLSGVVSAFYVHQGDRGGLITRESGKAPYNVGAAPDGRTMIDCKTFTYDLNTAMSGAGFKLEAVGADRDGSRGAGHVVLEVQDASGKPLGYFNNEAYKSYSKPANASAELQAAMRETLGPGAFTIVRHDPKEGPPKGVKK